MTKLQRRMKKLEGVFTDPAGFVPHMQKWLEYWDRQYHLFLTGKDEDATRRHSVHQSARAARRPSGCCVPARPRMPATRATT